MQTGSPVKFQLNGTEDLTVVSISIVNFDNLIMHEKIFSTRTRNSLPLLLYLNNANKNRITFIKISNSHRLFGLGQVSWLARSQLHVHERSVRGGMPAGVRV